MKRRRFFAVPCAKAPGAKAPGIAIPETIMLRADEVIR
jgi:hypothetical protein